MLVDNTQVTITFKYQHSHWDQYIYLNINETGAKALFTDGGSPMHRYEWKNNEPVTFGYSSTVNGTGGWVEANGGRATTLFYGVTKLQTSLTSTSESEAATPNSVFELSKKIFPVHNGDISVAVGEIRQRNGKYYQCVNDH